MLGKCKAGAVHALHGRAGLQHTEPSHAPQNHYCSLHLQSHDMALMGCRQAQIHACTSASYLAGRQQGTDNACRCPKAGRALQEHCPQLHQLLQHSFVVLQQLKMGHPCTRGPPHCLAFPALHATHQRPITSVAGRRAAGGAALGKRATIALDGGLAAQLLGIAAGQHGTPLVLV